MREQTSSGWHQSQAQYNCRAVRPHLQLNTTPLMVTLLSLVTPHTSVAQGVEFSGLYTWGAEVNVIAMCGTEEEFWVVTTQEILATIRRAHDSLTTQPYDEIFLAGTGWLGTGPIDGFADQYDGLWKIARIDSISPLSGHDCDGGTAPIGLDGSEQCDPNSSNTDDINRCALFEVMEIDRLLSRYTTEVWNLLSPTGFFETHRTRDLYRDQECRNVYDHWSDGTIRDFMFTNCRRSTAVDRLRHLWNFYLSNSITSLPEPEL